MLITVGSLLSEWLNDLADSHLFESFATFLVHAEVSNREQGNASWRLRGTFIVSHDIKQLLECMVLDKIFAKSIRVANKVAKSTCRVSSSFLFLILKKFN